MAELNVHFQEHGSSDVSLLANKYQHIPKPTWNRWVAEARCATVRATVATAVVQGIPEDPGPNLEVLRRIDPLRVLEQIDRVHHIADRLEGLALDEKGAVRLPKTLAMAGNLRLQAAKAQADAFSLVWNMAKIRALFDAVVEVIQQVSPEVAEAVIRKLHAAERSHRGL